jgi:hypothetical protein
MRKSFLAVLFPGIIFWASLIASKIVYNEFIEWAWGLSLIGLLLAVPATIIGGIFKYGVTARSWLPAPVLCVAVLLCTVLFRPYLKTLDDRNFKRDLIEYSRVVSDVKSGKVQINNFDRIDFGRENLPGRAIEVRASHCNQGTVVVRFYTLLQGALGDDCGVLFDDCDNPFLSEVHRKSLGHQMSFPSHIQGAWYSFCDH